MESGPGNGQAADDGWMANHRLWGKSTDEDHGQWCRESADDIAIGRPSLAETGGHHREGRGRGEMRAGGERAQDELLDDVKRKEEKEKNVYCEK